MKEYRKYIWLSSFAIAMAFLESAVVIYLREISYPEGFDFPLVPIEKHLALTEILREAATLIMLLSAGILVGKNTSERFAWFIYCFAMWDIFYYIFLKLLLNWPDSLMTWDILFLIPIVWVGPVISPLIISLTMILLAVLLIHFNQKLDKVRILAREWFLLIIGSLILIVAFTGDYTGFILDHYDFLKIWRISSQELSDLTMEYIPGKFNWLLFWIGEAIVLGTIGWLHRRNCRLINKSDNPG